MRNKATAKREELKVFIAARESKCDECGEDLSHQGLLI